MKESKVAGIQLETRYDLLTFCQPLLMPPANICRQLVTNPGAAAVVALLGRQYLVVPQQAGLYGVDGCCFTGPTQIEWMRQLSRMDGQWVGHMDGKYKLHHGVWILITFGVHCLKVVGEGQVNSLCTTFAPLMYLFCKNHESLGETIPCVFLMCT